MKKIKKKGDKIEWVKNKIRVDSKKKNDIQMHSEKFHRAKPKLLKQNGPS